MCTRRTPRFETVAWFTVGFVTEERKKKFEQQCAGLETERAEKRAHASRFVVSNKCRPGTVNIRPALSRFLCVLLCVSMSTLVWMSIFEDF